MRCRTRHLFAVAALLPSIVGAQGVVVQSVSDVRLFGALGTLANMAARFGGGNIHDVQTTTSVAGHKLRTESETDATIIDADAGSFTHIDHKQKTYSTITFADMAAAMQQGIESARQNAQSAKAEQAKAAQTKDPKARKDSLTFSYKVAVDRPGQHDKIAGYDAERVFLTITLEAEVTPENQKTEQAGSMVFLIDQYRSNNAPQIAALAEFQRAYAQKVGDTFKPAVQGLQAAFSSDPRIKTGFEAAGKELVKVPGVALRSMTYVALVSPGMTFDRQLVLNDAAVAAAADTAKKADAPKKGGFGGFMGALKSAAENANKKPADDKGKTDQQPTQATLLSVRDEVKSITPGPVPPGTFSPPTGYREVKRVMPAPPE